MNGPYCNFSISLSSVRPSHADLEVSAARSVDRVPEVCGIADHGAVDLDPGPVVAQARLLLGLAEREALADLNKNYIV